MEQKGQTYSTYDGYTKHLSTQTLEPHSVVITDGFSPMYLPLSVAPKVAGGPAAKVSERTVRSTVRICYLDECTDNAPASEITVGRASPGIVTNDKWRIPLGKKGGGFEMLEIRIHTAREAPDGPPRWKLDEWEWMGG